MGSGTGCKLCLLDPQSTTGNHAQTIVKINGEWFWLHAEVTPDSITPLSNLNGEIDVVNIFTLDDYIKDVQVRWAH